MNATAFSSGSHELEDQTNFTLKHSSFLKYSLCSHDHSILYQDFPLSLIFFRLNMRRHFFNSIYSGWCYECPGSVIVWQMVIWGHLQPSSLHVLLILLEFPLCPWPTCCNYTIILGDRIPVFSPVFFSFNYSFEVNVYICLNSPILPSQALFQYN